MSRAHEPTDDVLRADLALARRRISELEVELAAEKNANDAHQESERRWAERAGALEGERVIARRRISELEAELAAALSAIAKPRIQSIRTLREQNADPATRKDSAGRPICDACPVDVEDVQ